MSLIKYKLMGIGLILLSALVIYVSFAIFFLGLKIKLGGSDISPIIIKIINFAIIFLVFIYLAYVGYIMIFHAQEK
jgi:ABC-type Na+ efflux pump permease subunit